MTEKKEYMTSFEKALDIVLNNVEVLKIEQVGLLDGLGRVIAEDVIAPLNLPPFDNSAMDGYAVRLCDCHGREPLPITGYIPAGRIATTEVAPGSAIKVMTGAPVPRGCDSVVPFEDTTESADKVLINTVPAPGQYIRRAGEDVKAGDKVIRTGTLIRVPEVSMLASLGRTQVCVYRKPLVAVLATGDELAEPGCSLSEGKVFDSNSTALAAAVREAGAEALVLGIARDDREHLRQMITTGLQADVLITAAGVSVGDRDLVREVLAELGVTPLIWKVNIKPGKSMALGAKDGKLVFSLPGNPVSAMITFEELVRPAILKMMGHLRVIKQMETAVLQEGLQKPPGKICFARVRLERVNGEYLAWSGGDQGTGFLRTMLHTDALAILPAERTEFAAGEHVKVHILSSGAGMLEPHCTGSARSSEVH